LNLDAKVQKSNEKANIQQSKYLLISSQTSVMGKKNAETFGV